MLMIKKTGISLILFVSLVSLCFALSSGEKMVDEGKIGFEKIKNDIPIGMSFEDVKKYLNDKGIKYFSEKKKELTSLRQSDLDADFTFQLIFTITTETSGFGISSTEKYTLVIIRFGKDSLVNNLLMESAYKGL